MKNGNVLFAAGSKLFLSTDNLKTYQQITVKAADGSDYVPHTPQNADNPGWYFHTLPGIVSWDVRGVEMLVWGITATSSAARVRSISTTPRTTAVP